LAQKQTLRGSERLPTHTLEIRGVLKSRESVNYGFLSPLQLRVFSFGLLEDGMSGRIGIWVSRSWRVWAFSLI
jgi:hypothetical protein